MSKKMRLIPHLEYEKLIAAHKAPQLLHKSAEVNQFNRQQVLASDVLDWNLISDDIKLALFNNTIKGLRSNFEALTNTPHRVEVLDTNVSTPTIHKTSVEPSTDGSFKDTNLLQILPKNYRGAAEEIMRILSDSRFKEVSWNESGQVFFRGVKRRGAHIIDLLSYVIRPPSKSKPPIGIHTFVYTLRRLKVPLDLLESTLDRN